MDSIDQRSFNNLYEEVRDLLRVLIATPSHSTQESTTADVLEQWLHARGVDTERYGNNVVARHVGGDDQPIILLNSHHDTVKPGGGWTSDPYTPTLRDGRLYGLGSNDAGGALVTMLATFVHLRQIPDLQYGIIVAATAEEEISGQHGMALLARDVLPPLHVALVGEPTQMQMAIAEKGLMVLDVIVHGVTGHAARDEGTNAIARALPIIDWFHTYQFDRPDSVLGTVKMTVTQINAGSQHNVVPDRCHLVVDVRIPGQYRHEDVLDVIRRHMAINADGHVDLQPRSMRLRSSRIDADHPLVCLGHSMGLTSYASPTMSDQALLPIGVPSMKIGPGDSARSHTPDEYITLEELRSGIATLCTLLERYCR